MIKYIKFHAAVSVIGIFLCFSIAESGRAWGNEQFLYTLKECANTAIENSYQLKSYDSKIRQSEAKTKEILAAKNIHTSLSGSSTYQQPELEINMPLSQGEIAGGIVTPRWYHSYTLNLTKVLTTFGKLETSAQYYKIAQAVNAGQQKIEEDQLLFETAKAYYTVIQAYELLDVAKAELELWQQQYRVSQSQYNRGAVAQFDLLKTQVSLTRAQEHIITAEKNLQVAKGNLKTLMGVEESPEIDPEGGEENWNIDRPIDVEQLMQTLNDKNPALLLCALMIEQNEKAVETARYELAPSLSFQTGYGLNTKTFATKDYTWKNSLNINVPLGDGGEKNEKIKQAQESVTQAQLSLADTKRNIHWNLEQALLELTELRAKYKTANEERVSAEETARVAKLRYTNGLGTIVEITDANKDLVTAQNKCKQIKCALQIQSASISYLCGTIYQDIMGVEK